MPDKIAKFIASLDKKKRAQLKKKMEELKSSPYALSDVKKLQGCNDLYRLRIGKMRIVYSIKNGIVEIRDIDYRGNIY